MPRRKSSYKNGVRIVRFPGGRIAKFHKPGTVGFAKGAAKKRAAGKRLAKIYGFTKKRKTTKRRTVRSNPRVSKTELLHVVQGYYPQYGWEDLATSTVLKEAKDDIKAYRENQPGAYRLIKRRVPKATNPKRKTKKRRNPPSDAFNVYKGRKLIGTVFATKGSYTAAEMKRSLINHDGYDYRITVKKARK